MYKTKVGFTEGTVPSNTTQNLHGLLFSQDPTGWP